MCRPSQFKLRIGKTEKQKAAIPPSILKKFASNVQEAKSSEKAPALSNKIKEKIEDFVNNIEVSIKDSPMMLTFQFVKLLVTKFF